MEELEVITEVIDYTEQLTYISDQLTTLIVLISCIIALLIVNIWCRGFK